MTRFETPRVAIIGAGEIGRGWAALAVSAGWPVAIYDAESEILQRASENIAERVEMLTRLGRTDQARVGESLDLMRVGRSLLQTVTDADWIIEAAPEDLHLKQKLLEQVEQVSRLAAIVTSSASGIQPSALCARLRRPERLMVAHPLTPVELVPLVEVVPGPRTDPACVEDVRFWLQLLGQVPIVLKKELPGHAIGRIQAAVWRECIHLVLQGVLDVDDVDAAVAMGPALGWAAAGPHLTHHLAAGESGAEMYLARALGDYETLWGHLADWQKLEGEDQKRLIKAIEKTYAGQSPEQREKRDRKLAAMRKAQGENDH